VASPQSLSRNRFILFRLLRGKVLPLADFDLLYFMEVMQEFCSQHNLLKEVLAGKGDDSGANSKPG
jgi:hypothetical protein